MYFDQDSHSAVDEFVPQTTGRPTLSYPLGQVADAVADSGPFGVLGGMERQSQMIYMDRSSGPLSAFVDHDAWPRPDHTPSTSDLSDRGSFSQLSNPLEDASSLRSVSQDLPFILFR